MNCWATLKTSVRSVSATWAAVTAVASRAASGGSGVVSALKEIAQADIELLQVVQRVGGEVSAEHGDKLRVPRKGWVRAEIGGDFLRLVLLDLRTRRLDAGTVGQQPARLPAPA